MNNTRRTFLKNSAFALAGSSIVARIPFANTKDNELVGIQLYSVRDDMGKDPLGTLKQLAAMGYKNVEHANYRERKFYGYTPTEFKKILNDLGMKMPSGHTVLGSRHWDETKKEFTDLWKYTVEDAATMGQQFVISPSLDQNYRKDRGGIASFYGSF